MDGLKKLSLVLILIASFMVVGAAQAQFSFTALGNIRVPDTATKFSLSPPGARSLAMGGAFVGLADDATAAYTNPAGLTNLALGGSEVAIEARQTRFTTTFTDRGHYPTNPQYNSVPTFIGEDSVLGLPPTEAETETSGLSFLSFGYVLPGGLTLAVYRHQLANFKSSFESQGPFNDFPCGLLGDPSCRLWRVQPQRTTIDLEILNYGISAAYGFDLPSLKGLESNLSLGVGVSYYTAAFDAMFETFDLCHVAGYDGSPGDCIQDRDFRAEDQRLPGAFFGPADFSVDNHINDITEAGDDQAFGLSLGFLWKLGRQQKWSVGGVFRQGPDFETRRFNTSGHHRDFLPHEDHAFVRWVDPPGRVTVPDVFALGLAFRTASGNTKITFDVNRVRYSQTLGDFTASFRDFFVGDPNLYYTCLQATDFCTPEGGFLNLPPQDFVVGGPVSYNSNFDPATRTLDVSGLPILTLDNQFDIPDVTQLHLGFERIVLVVESLFVGTVRFGAWHEPFHEPTYIAEADPADEGDQIQVADRRALFTRAFTRTTDDETHLSAGFGLVIKEDYQIDLAVDISDPVTTFSFSLVKFF